MIDDRRKPALLRLFDLLGIHVEGALDTIDAFPEDIEAWQILAEEYLQSYAECSEVARQLLRALTEGDYGFILGESWLPEWQREELLR